MITSSSIKLLTAAAGYAQNAQGIVFSDVVTATVTSANPTITIPNTIVAGQVAILVHSVVVASATDQQYGIPAPNWQQITSFDGIYYNFSAHMKVLQESDKGLSIDVNYSFDSFNTPDDVGAVLYIFDVGSANPTITAYSVLSEVTEDGTSPNAITITSGSGNAPLIVFGACIADDISPPSFSVASPSFDQEVSSPSLLVGYKIYNSTPTNHTIDMNTGNQFENILVGFYIEVTT